jgi:hypothetical protein
MYQIRGNVSRLPHRPMPAPHEDQYVHRFPPSDLQFLQTRLTQLPLNATRGIEFSVHADRLSLVVDMDAADGPEAQLQLFSSKWMEGIPTGCNLDIMVRTISALDLPSLSAWPGAETEWMVEVFTGTADRTRVKAVHMEVHVCLTQARRIPWQRNRVDLYVQETGHAGRRWCSDSRAAQGEFSLPH